MAFFEFLYRHGLWIGPLLLAAAVSSLVRLIMQVVRLRAKNQLLSVPAVEQQDLELRAAGPVVLCTEGPLFTRRFARTDFALSGDDGVPLAGRTTWFHASTSGLSRITMEMKRYDIPAPGRYTLRISNWGAPQPGDEEHRLIFVRPHLAAMMATVVGIVCASSLSIGSLVLFLLRLLLKDSGT